MQLAGFAETKKNKNKKQKKLHKWKGCFSRLPLWMKRHPDIPSGDVVRVACPLEDWAPAQHWGKVVRPEAAEVALCKLRNSLKGQSTCSRSQRWLFLTVFKKATDERDMLLQEVATHEH